MDGIYTEGRLHGRSHDFPAGATLYHVALAHQVRDLTSCCALRPFRFLLRLLHPSIAFSLSAPSTRNGPPHDEPASDTCAGARHSSR
jgi:hypothetical protein